MGLVFFIKNVKRNYYQSTVSNQNSLKNENFENHLKITKEVFCITHT